MGIEEDTFWDEHWVLSGNQFDNKLHILKKIYGSIWGEVGDVMEKVLFGDKFAEWGLRSFPGFPTECGRCGARSEESRCHVALRSGTTSWWKNFL